MRADGQGMCNDALENNKNTWNYTQMSLYSIQEPRSASLQID
jgi:hypothetical protein